MTRAMSMWWCLAVLLMGAALALTHERNEQWGSGISLWGDALRKAPLKARPHVNYAVALLKERGDEEQAERELRAALAIRPFYPLAHLELGKLHARRGETAEAIRHFRAPLERYPDIGDLWYELAVAYEEQGMAREAREAYGRAFALRPGLEGVHRQSRESFARGVAALEEGRDEEAESAFRAVLDLRPSFNRARYHLAEVLMRTGRYEEAADEMSVLLERYRAAFQEQMADRPIERRVESMVPLWRLRALLGESYYRLGRHEEARAELRASLALNPSNAAVLNLLGLAAAAAGDVEEARVSWEEALRVEPSFGLAHESLGLLFAGPLADDRKAVYHLCETLKHFPDHPSRAWIEEEIARHSSSPAPCEAP